MTWADSCEASRSALAAEAMHRSGRLRLRVRGESMLPTLWPGEIVTIEHCSFEELQPNDIVLAHRDDRLFLHRLLERHERTFILRGDSVPKSDREYNEAAFLGRLARGGPALLPSRRSIAWSRLVGLFLCYCSPVRRLALRIHGSKVHGETAVSATQPTSALPAADLGAF